MSPAIEALRNWIAVIENPEWSGETAHSHSAPHNISYYEEVDGGFQTLSTASAAAEIHGLLYVPDLQSTDVCKNLSATYVPRNATRQANLPNTDYNLIALAPWFNASCALSYMESAAQDPIRAFLFYQPNTTDTPSGSGSAWDTDDGGAWKGSMHYPVYGISGTLGERMMRELSLYSGNVTDVPYGHDLIELNVDPRDYVRVATKIFTTSGSTSLNIWVFLLIVVGSLLLILVSSFATIHVLQRKRREALRRRIARGDVDLEALGIKRLTVPADIIAKMPMYIYAAEEDDEHSMHEDDDANHAQGHANAQDQQHTHSPNHERIPDEPLSPFSPTSATGSEFLFSKSKHSATRPQPTCPICLEDFEPGLTVVRELPCHHVYHPDCIDAVLTTDSSLCPICKMSMIPIGYCPTNITNAMVRRERMVRRLRSRIMLEADGTLAEGRDWRSWLRDWTDRIIDPFGPASGRMQRPRAAPPAVILQQQQQAREAEPLSPSLPPTSQYTELIEPQRVIVRDPRDLGRVARGAP